MAIKKVYKSTLKGGNYITRRGKTLIFVEGKYITDREEEVQELEQEIKSGHPYLYIDPAEAEIDTTLQEKLEAAKRAVVDKVLAEHYAANPDANKSVNEAGGVASGTISPAALTAAAVQIKSPATALGVATSATLGSLSAPSNQK